MRKVFLASLLAVIMLMVPVTSASQTTNISYVKNITTAGLDTPQIFITEAERFQIDLFIEENFEGEDKQKAYDIVNEIISYDLQVDVVELAEAWVLYGYEKIPQEEIDNAPTTEALEALIMAYWLLNIFADLLMFVTTIIAGRLGWMYYFINEGMNLFVQGVGIVIDFLYITLNSLKALISTLNQVLTIPQVFAEALDELFNHEYAAFLNTIGSFLSGFALNFVDLVLGLIALLANFAEIVNYLAYGILPFFGWLDTDPWTGQIRILGIVRENIFFPVVGATVTCKGETAVTDENGEFDFLVDPQPDGNSFPPDEFFGMHRCTITVEKDGQILKESTGILSYVFSSGYIYCPVFTFKSRSASLSLRLMDKINNFFARLQVLAPNLYRNIQRLGV